MKVTSAIPILLVTYFLKSVIASEDNDEFGITTGSHANNDNTVTTNNQDSTDDNDNSQSQDDHTTEEPEQTQQTHHTHQIEQNLTTTTSTPVGTTIGTPAADTTTHGATRVDTAATTAAHTTPGATPAATPAAASQHHTINPTHTTQVGGTHTAHTTRGTAAHATHAQHPPQTPQVQQVPQATTGGHAQPNVATGGVRTATANPPHGTTGQVPAARPQQTQPYRTNTQTGIPTHQGVPVAGQPHQVGHQRQVGHQPHQQVHHPNVRHAGSTVGVAPQAQPQPQPQPQPNVQPQPQARIVGRQPTQVPVTVPEASKKPPRIPKFKTRENMNDDDDDDYEEDEEEEEGQATLSIPAHDTETVLPDVQRSAQDVPEMELPPVQLDEAKIVPSDDYIPPVVTMDPMNIHEVAYPDFPEEPQDLFESDEFQFVDEEEVPPVVNEVPQEPEPEPEHHLKQETQNKEQVKESSDEPKKCCSSKSEKKKESEKGDGECPCGMPSYFVFRYGSTLLLKDLKTETAFHYYVALASIFVISLFPYMLKTLRTVIIIKLSKRGSKAKSTLSIIISFLLSLPILTLDYGLMLLAMTFNVGYFFAIVGGLSLSYSIFGHILDSPCNCKPTLPSDCCS